MPTQDLSIPLNQFPALPRSGFVFHYTGRAGARHLRDPKMPASHNEREEWNEQFVE